MGKQIGWEQHEHLFQPGVTAGWIALRIPCCERVVYSHAKMMGFSFARGGLVADDRYENKTIDYLALLGRAVTHRPLEGLSGC
ncbi:hypothetical protein ES708_00707 [subsurface metagenome]